MATRSFVPVWCSCNDDGEHLAPFGVVCALGVTTAAAVQPARLLVAQQPIASIGSSHRTGNTQRSFGLVTPLGRTSRFVSPI